MSTDALIVPDPLIAPVPRGWWEAQALPRIEQADDFAALDEAEGLLLAKASLLESMGLDAVEFLKALRVVEARRGILAGVDVRPGERTDLSTRGEVPEGTSQGTLNRWRTLGRHWRELLDYLRAKEKPKDVSQAACLRHVAPPTVVEPGSLPEGKYTVLYSDPPWRYEWAETPNRAIENQYPTLTADEIACYEDAEQRPVADLPADDAVLFLWATNPKLLEALKVLEGWGFEYVTNAVWVKDRIGMGYWFRQKHELLLVGRRGKYPAPIPANRYSSVIHEPRLAHSAKPEYVYGLIEAMTPGASRVEVFGRTRRDGWASFGNQL